MREALRALIAREAGRRLARLGGTMPDFKAPPRRAAFADDPGRYVDLGRPFRVAPMPPSRSGRAERDPAPSVRHRRARARPSARLDAATLGAAAGGCRRRRWHREVELLTLIVERAARRQPESALSTCICWLRAESDRVRGLWTRDKRLASYADRSWASAGPSLIDSLLPRAASGRGWRGIRRRGASSASRALVASSRPTR